MPPKRARAKGREGNIRKAIACTFLLFRANSAPVSGQILVRCSSCQVQAGSLSPPRGSRFMSAVRRTSSAGEVPGTSHRAWLARGMLRNSQSMTSMTSLLSPPLMSCDGLYISLAPTQQGERYACAGAQEHVCGSTRASAVLTHCRLCRRVSEAFALSTEVRETR
jgi:hypothetical protein